MGGTSGALYSYVLGLMSPVSPQTLLFYRIFFSGLSRNLQAVSGNTVVAKTWALALKLTLDNLYTYTRARPPSRTLVDPLSAFIRTFSLGDGQNLRDAASAASRAAEETKNLEAKAGRSAYIEGDKLKREQIPDPGAWGIKIILENITN